MKKTLAAVAVLGAFAGSALAADVTLYGLVDMGLGYSHVDNNGTKTDSWGLESGQNSMSRIGFKGTEQLTEDVTVGFVLENGFHADNGTLYSAFFHRQSSLFVKTAFGEVGMGRFGALDSTTGSYNMAGSSLHATTGVAGVGDTGVIFLGQKSRMDNSVVYVSPEFAGFQVRAMASLGGMDDEQEASSDTDRYYALGASYKAGAFSTKLIVSQLDRGHKAANVEDALTVTAGARYDFGVTTVSLAAQYFDEASVTLLDKTAGELNGKGYAVTLGAVTPVMGGDLTTQAGYVDAEAVANSDQTRTAWNVGAIYEYPLSKRTMVYGALGYQVEEDEAIGYSYEVKAVNAGFGMVHKF